jgi:Domain of unknown function (DUF4157)
MKTRVTRQQAPNPVPARGQPLEPATQALLEPLFSHCFRDVRVHDGSEADRFARSHSARAVTLGQDLFFRAGAYDTDSADGLALLAHELTHTVQQSKGPQIGQRIGGGDPFEKEAQRAARSVLSGQPVSMITSGGAPTLQCSREDEVVAGVSTDATAPPQESDTVSLPTSPQQSVNPSVSSAISPTALSTAGNVRNAVGNTALLTQHAIQRYANSVPGLIPNPAYDPGRIIINRPTPLTPTITGSRSRGMSHFINPTALATHSAADEMARGLSHRGNFGRGMAGVDAALTYGQARAQGQGQLEAGVGAAASATSNLMYSASPIDLGINLANYTAQAAGAPQGVQDTLGVVASATPSSFIQSIAAHTGRATANLVSLAQGDSSGFRRQGQDIVSGSNGNYPLQGYGLTAQALWALAHGENLDRALDHVITPEAANNPQQNAASRGPLVALGNHAADIGAEAQRGPVNPHRSVTDATVAERAEAERRRRFEAEQLPAIIDRAYERNRGM